MKWKVELIGDSYLLKSLSTEMNTSEELSIFEESGHFYITNTEFENFNLGR